MNTTLIIILFLLGFGIYWTLIRDGIFKQGVGKYINKDYGGAIKDLNKSLVKNPNHKKAYYYLGLCYMQIAKDGGIYESEFKSNAVEYLIKSSDLDSNNERANNMVEHIIGTEQNEKTRKTLIIIATKEINKAKTDLKREYSWLNKYDV